jgi:hypothetical protein
VGRWSRLRRASPNEWLALIAFVLALGAGLWQLPGAVRDHYRAIGGLQGATVLDRQLSGARSVDIDVRILEEARRLIPPDAVYAVVTGPGADISTPITLSAVPPYAGYWLLPRRRVADASADVDWIVSYGGDLDGLGLTYSRIVKVGAGLEIAEVAH